MRPTVLALLTSFLLLATPTARSEEPLEVNPDPPLTMTLELSKEPVGYAAPIRVTAVVTNRSVRPIPFWHTLRLDGPFRFEFEDRNGLRWRPIDAEFVLLPTRARRSWTAPSSAATTLMPGQSLRLTFELRAFVPQSPRGSGLRWLASVPPGDYTVRLTYAQENPFVWVYDKHAPPRILSAGPPQTLRVIPGLFTGRLEAEAKLSVVAPTTEAVEMLHQRIRELEQENARLRAVIDVVRKALPPK
ncbi:MAG: hypothetical protein QNJ98_06965 [Planctomycetota bacterium]|nr:hypothetical protein [Planctomycetota bacterium]